MKFNWLKVHADCVSMKRARELAALKLENRALRALDAASKNEPAEDFKTLSLPDAILSRMNGHPVKAKELRSALDGHPVLNDGNMKNSIKRLLRREKIKRVGHGLYQRLCLAFVLCALSATAQLTTPKATPTADKPMAKPVAPPMPTASLVVAPQPQTVSVGIAWDPSESLGVTGYRVYSTDASGVVAGFGDVGDVRTYQINGLTNGPWKLEVTAVTATAESAPATLMFYNEKVLEYYGQTAPTFGGQWTDLTPQPFQVITNPTAPAEFTRIRVHPKRR